jgi:hypothetical protein
MRSCGFAYLTCHVVACMVLVRVDTCQCHAGAGRAGQYQYAGASGSDRGTGTVLLRPHTLCPTARSSETVGVYRVDPW